MMDFLEKGILILFSLWLLTSIWFALGSDGQMKKIRALLGRNGWFHKWRMFVPDVGVVSGGFIISYRDQTATGEIGHWMIFDSKRKWKPQIALINPRIRVSAFIRQAGASFGRMRLLGKQAEDAAYYSFFLSIMLQYQLPDGTSKRQIRVEQTTGEDVFVVMESEFISIV